MELEKQLLNVENSKVEKRFPKSLPKKTFALKILDQELKLTTDKSEAQALKLAAYVEKMVNDVTRKAPSASPQKAYMIAALTIADQYFSSLELHAELKKEMFEKSQKVLDLLEDATDF